MRRTWVSASWATLIAITLLSACTFIAPTSPTVPSVTEAATSATRTVIAAPTAARSPTQVALIITPPLTPTATITLSPEKEMAVLQQTAQSLCTVPYPPPRITTQGAVYALNCTLAAGHSTTATIQRFDSAAEAQTAFSTAAKSHPAQDLYGYPVAAWEEPYPGLAEAKNRILVWKADRWLIRITSFDDTHFRIALEPRKVAETIHQFAVQQGLFSK